jgi:hypothetical protein
MTTEFRSKRSPIKSVLMPRPGRSLREQLILSVFRAVCIWMATASILILTALSDILEKGFPGSSRTFRWGIAGMAVTVSVAVWLLYRHRIDRLQLGIEGETEVAQFLDELRTHGYYVFHSIQCDGFDLDHALIGPAGVFVIETKTVSKRGGKDEVVTYDGEKILVDGRAPDRDPVAQARRNANTLSEILREKTGEPVHVQAIVLYPGWFVKSAARDAEVLVANPKYAVAILRGLRSLQTKPQIERQKEGIIRY